MEKQKEKKYLFEEMPVRKAILKLAVPTIISQLISVIYNIADTLYVGRTGNPYMIGALSLSLPLFLISISFANLFGIGCGSLISRMMGAGEEKDAKSVSAFAFYGALSFSVIYSLMIFAFMKPVLNILGASANTCEYAVQYTTNVVVYGFVPMVLSSVLSHLLRNTGYSSLAGIGLSGGGIMNIILDPLFMFVIYPKGQEVLAAAVATLLSNICSCVFLIVVLLKVSKHAPLSIYPGDLLKIKTSVIRKAFSVGIPSALLPGLFDISNLVLNSLMASHGDYELAAIGIVMKIDRLPNAVNIGISQGMLPLVAYNFSSGNRQRMQKVINTARNMGLIISLICILVFQFFGKYFVSVFLSSKGIGAAAATLAFAVSFLRLRCWSSPFQMLNYHTSYCMQAMGDGRDTLIHAFMRIVVFYIPLMYILDSFMGATGICLAFPFGEILGGFFALLLLFRYIRKT